ncbi:ABC transporter permease [Hamadaea tsunoensis]|uniref:ABC transporter permease n=1 Tax=Hamadaea tsunoensis TaxID=53368 RepID=UPI000428C6D7|nr:FtsX-like permease family protein [Hamadaea tsunoensis]
MSAVWTVTRATLRRRKAQALVIGLVLTISSATVALAAGLLVASSAPFEHAFAQQNGAHLTVNFDGTKVTDTELAATAQNPAVTAAAGPYAEAALNFSTPDMPELSAALHLVVVGRATPDGAVDRLTLDDGRWANGPGEIVVDGPLALGTTLNAPGLAPLTVVGHATSVTESANAWVTPEQMAALHPTGTEMLYRLRDAATSDQVSAGLRATTSGLPGDAVLGSQSYLAVRDSVQGRLTAFVPFLVAFGVLGLVVGIMIVINVVSGAVVSGFRHIGVLRGLGFTTTQVVAIYLLMISVPAVIGSVVGTIAGGALSAPLLTSAFASLGGTVTTPPWIEFVTVVGMPAIVGVAAIVPALRTRRVSTVEALSAGSAPRRGRVSTVQRRLSGTRLRRSVSLGLGLPFVRPGRSLLTMASVVLGVTAVTFAIGLTSSLTRFQAADPQHHVEGTQVTVVAGVDGRPPASGRTDEQIESLLRSLPHTRQVITEGSIALNTVGDTRRVILDAFRGPPSLLGYQIVQGRWYTSPQEVVISSRFLHEHQMKLGDSAVLAANGEQRRVVVVGEVMTGGADEIYGDWATLRALTPATAVPVDAYHVFLVDGTDIAAYVNEAHALDPDLRRGYTPSTGSFNAIVIGFAALFTLLLSVVTALGVFNTVILDTRERRRDLGMLKSIGMTPGQVTTMMVTSMAALGFLGGLLGVPLGIVTHRLVMPLVSQAGHIDVPPSLMDVWGVPTLALPALAGTAIAALGAFLPARRAAYLSIAEVLHGE